MKKLLSLRDWWNIGRCSSLSSSGGVQTGLLRARAVFLYCWCLLPIWRTPPTTFSSSLWCCLSIFRLGRSYRLFRRSLTQNWLIYLFLLLTSTSWPQYTVLSAVSFNFQTKTVHHLSDICQHFLELCRVFFGLRNLKKSNNYPFAQRPNR